MHVHNYYSTVFDVTYYIGSKAFSLRADKVCDMQNKNLIKTLRALSLGLI